MGNLLDKAALTRRRRPGHAEEANDAQRQVPDRARCVPNICLWLRVLNNSVELGNGL